MHRRRTSGLQHRNKRPTYAHTTDNPAPPLGPTHAHRGPRIRLWVAGPGSLNQIERRQVCRCAGCTVTTFAADSFSCRTRRVLRLPPKLSSRSTLCAFSVLLLLRSSNHDACQPKARVGGRRTSLCEAVLGQLIVTARAPSQLPLLPPFSPASSCALCTCSSAAAPDRPATEQAHRHPRSQW